MATELGALAASLSLLHDVHDVRVRETADGEIVRVPDGEIANVINNTGGPNCCKLRMASSPLRAMRAGTDSASPQPRTAAAMRSASVSTMRMYPLSKLIESADAR